MKCISTEVVLYLYENTNRLFGVLLGELFDKLKSQLCIVGAPILAASHERSSASFFYMYWNMLIWFC